MTVKHGIDFSFGDGAKARLEHAPIHPQICPEQMATRVTAVTPRRLSFRLECIAATVLLCVSLASVIQRNYVGAGDELMASECAGAAGFSLTTALSVCQLLNQLVRVFSDYEMRMNSVERLSYYAQMETEAPEIVEENRYETQRT